MRQRIEEDEKLERLAPLQPVDEPQVLSASVVAVEQSVAPSDDEDESDFEIPPLVMKTDFEDDDEEE